MIVAVNTGYERAQTLNIDKKVGGVSVIGYPKNYSIVSAFTISNRSYPSLTMPEFQQLTGIDYSTRLTDFKAYVEAAEFGLVLDAVTSPSALPYRENTTSCPIGA
ncbi:MAG: hypothetical protein JW783_00385 [Bacteroidales bacterium]|nr:hypothetical protein [Bacteroidales bacterium]MBN2748478.1 hypothetical protein [Bacteroidales bacterium]